MRDSVLEATWPRRLTRVSPELRGMGIKDAEITMSPRLAAKFNFDASCPCRSGVEMCWWRVPQHSCDHDGDASTSELNWQSINICIILPTENTHVGSVRQKEEEEKSLSIVHLQGILGSLPTAPPHDKGAASGWSVVEEKLQAMPFLDSRSTHLDERSSISGNFMRVAEWYVSMTAWG